MSTILSRLTDAQNKGVLLEQVVEDILKDRNFINVRRQTSGSQYGYDVSAYKRGNQYDYCWKFECKNLQSFATINDIAPKLLWHVDSAIERFVIVSVNGISNDVVHLLEQRLFGFPIEIWSGEYLELAISESQRAMNRLGLTSSECSVSENAKPLVFEANDLFFAVTYTNGSPFSYDYFKLGEETIKAYSEVDFKLTGIIKNKSSKDFVIQQILVKTLRYETTDNMRVLRQYTQKGLIEPIKMVFTPIPKNNAGVNLLSNQLFEVKAFTNSYIAFELSHECAPGYYAFNFEVIYFDGSKLCHSYTPIFSLHKASKDEDMPHLSVLEFYDTPVDGILRAPDDVWQTIKEDHPGCWKFLGPSLSDRDYQSKTWTVNVLKGERKELRKGKYEVSFPSTMQSTILIDLGIPIEEKIYTQKDLMRRIISD